jgi:hypothetical protein
MRGWMDGPASTAEEWPDDDADWKDESSQSMERLLEKFQAVRQEQLVLLDHLNAVNWTGLRKTGWGQKSLAWIVTKTFQHTYEHGDTLLRMGLWRQHIEAQIAAARALEEK